MKIQLLIIFGIVTVSIGLGTSAYVINVQSQCESMLGDTHYPRPLTFWNCLEFMKMTENSNISEVNSGWITDEDYCGKWCNQKELYQMGCNKQILRHIYKYTNLLDEDFDGTFSGEWVGLPEGVSEKKYQECIDFIYEQRRSLKIEKIAPTIDDFRETLSKSIEIETIFSKFGTPQKDIGSGIHIYVYELEDATQVWIGYTDRIWYVRHVDPDGNVLEKLFDENEN